MTQVQEAKPTTKAASSSKTGDFIIDTAAEVEALTKTKALNRAEKLAETIDTSYFELGGVLQVIFNQAWFEGFESFDVFVYEKFGFQARKARYLMEIYSELVTKQIPWDKVQHLGWTKLKDLARHLTLENVDEWVEKASKCTVIELQAMLKAGLGEAGEAPATQDNITKLAFKLHNDQVETVTTALNKAKAECNTEYDNVALEMICAGYIGGNIAVQAAEGSPAEQLKALMAGSDWQQVLETFAELYPDVNLTVEVPE